MIAAARLNNVPNGDAVCRTNKVNKEELIAMLVALEVFLDRDHDAVWRSWEDKCRLIASAVEKMDDVETEIFVPEIANAVPHLRIKWDYDARGCAPRKPRANSPRANRASACVRAPRKPMRSRSPCG